MLRGAVVLTSHREVIIMLRGAIVLTRQQESVMMKCSPIRVGCRKVLGLSSPSIEFLEHGGWTRGETRVSVSVGNNYFLFELWLSQHEGIGKVVFAQGVGWAIRWVFHWDTRFQLWVGPNSRVEFGTDGMWVSEMKFWNSEVNSGMRGIVVIGCLKPV